MSDPRLRVSAIRIDEDRFYLCRPCRSSKRWIYPEGPETCPRLPEHELCDDCGQKMELVDERPRHVITARSLTMSDQAYDDLVAAGKRHPLLPRWKGVDEPARQRAIAAGLAVYKQGRTEFHYSDHLETAFGPPSEPDLLD